MRAKSISITLIALFMFSFASGGEKERKIQESIVINRIGFETTQELLGWEAKRGNLRLSAKHQKQGEHSLLWQMKKGDRLTIRNLQGLNEACGYYSGGQPEMYEPAYYPKGKYGGIKMWIYQEESNLGNITFQVGSDVKSAVANPKYRFTINLNFTGWRAVWIQFNEDAKVEGYRGNEDMHSLVAIPSADMEGSLFIDHFNLLEFVSYKRHSDSIIKNRKAVVRTDSYEILTPWEKYQNLEYQNSDEKINIQDVKTIEQRLEYLILGGEEQSWKEHYADIESKVNSSVEKAEATFAKLNIKQDADVITGVSLFSGRDEHGTPDGLQFQTVMQSTVFPLAIDYRMNNNADSKDKLLKLTAYLNDQGWAAGSALGTVDHIIRLSSYSVGMFLVRNDLDSDNRKTQQECLAWHTRIGNIIDGDRSVGENTDLVRGGALPKLISILLMPNSPQKAEMLKAFKKYMDYVASFAPGYSDTFKPDFSIYHHRGTYLNSYGIQAINSIAMIRWLLNGTDYALSEETDETLKEVLIRQYEIAHGLKLHPGVCGRFPYKNTSIDRYLLPAYAFMSLGDGIVDDYLMAKAFKYLYKISPPSSIYGVLQPTLSYSGTYGTLNIMAHLNREVNEEVSPLDGNYSLPYSCLSVHRRGAWLASVKGYSRYIWDYETGHQGENNLGRYLSHGAIFIFNSNPKGSMANFGMDMNEGFHWGYLPGATTKALPIEKVYFENKPTEKYKEGFHRSFSETTFAGGLSMEGSNGMFAMELRDDVSPAPNNVLFDNTFRAKKSYFFFDDEIVCMGTDISNADNEYSTITTLFQNNIGKRGVYKGETFIDGKSVGSSLNVELKLQGGVFTDVQGVNYIVSKDDSICFMQSNQQSLQKEEGKYKPISAPHAKAYINHGEMPNNGSYEYLILPKASIAEALDRKDNLGYEVLQKDSIAHIVKHSKLQLTGYAVFNTSSDINKGLLIKVDTPTMLMLKEQDNNILLTVMNPDLKLGKWNHNMSVMPKEIVHKWSQGSIVTLVLRGNWKPAAYVYELLSSEYKDGKTQLEIYCKDGKSIDIPLRKQ